MDEISKPARAAEERKNLGQQMMWGLVLIGIGLVFLFDRAGAFEIRDIWHWWPLIFFVIGFGHLLFPNRPVDRVESIWWFGLGTWFLATQNEWWGLRWSNSWPLILLVIGLQTVVRALFEAREQKNKGEVQS